MVLASSIGKQVAPGVYQDANKKKKIQAIPGATSVSEEQAMFGSGVTPGLSNPAPTITPPVTTTSMTQEDLYRGLPTPKVATKANPVVDMSKPKQQPTFNQYDTSYVTGLDINGLQDFIDQTNIDVRRGTPLTPEREAQLLKAQRRLQELSMPQAQANPIEAQLAEAEKLRKEREQELAATSQQLLDKRRAELEAQYGIKSGELQQQGQKTMSAAQGVLSFSGFGRSTYAAEKQAEIQDSVNKAQQSLQAEKDYAIAKYQAELAGADAETLASYDENINQLRQQNAQYKIGLAQAMNEYNQQTGASYQEKIDNIFKLAQQNAVIDLTDAEKQQASSFATLLIDAEGNVDTKLLEQIPTRLANEALLQASVLKSSIRRKPETVELGDELYQLGEDGQWTKVAGNKKSEWKSDGIGGFWRTNPITGAPEEWNGQGTPPSSGPQQGPSQGTTNTTDLIKKWEGFRGEAYLDPVGIPTIGYGFTSINGKPVQLGQTMSREQADAMLQDKIQEYSNWRNFVSADLSPSQEAALTSFEFNLGKGIWEKNAMGILEDINKGNLQSAANKMKQYVNAGGKMLPGLANRRREEAQLLMTPKEFDLMGDAPQQGKQYSQSQKNLMSGMKDKSLGATELKLLKQQGLTANDVYDYNASQKGLELSDDQRTMFNTQTTKFQSNKQVQAFEEAMQNYYDISASLDDTSGVGDMAGVYQFMKSLDPQSVVRETEFNTAASSAGVLNKLGNTFERLSEGKVLTAEQAKAFKKLARTYIENRAKTYDRLYADMERVLSNSKIDKSFYPTKASSVLKENIKNENKNIVKYTPNTDYPVGTIIEKSGKNYVVGADGNFYEQ